MSTDGPREPKPAAYEPENGNVTFEAQGGAPSTSDVASDSPESGDLSSVRSDPDPAQRPWLKDEGLVTGWSSGLNRRVDIEVLQKGPDRSAGRSNALQVSSEWQGLRDGVLSGDETVEVDSDDEEDEAFTEEAEDDASSEDDLQSTPAEGFEPRIDFTSMLEV